MDDRSQSEGNAIPEELVEFVKSELYPGEQLLWAGVSRPWQPVNTWAGLKGFVLALLCLGLSSFLFYSIFGPWRARLLAWENPILWSALALGLVGISSFVVSLFIWDEYRMRRAPSPKMTYALTDRRAIVWTPLAGTSAVEVITYFPKMIKKLHRVEYPDGSGDVIFAGPTFDDEEEGAASSGFFGVDEVRRVEDLVRRSLLESDLRVDA
jgi:hypothetical protein